MRLAKKSLIHVCTSVRYHNRRLYLVNSLTRCLLHRLIGGPVVNYLDYGFEGPGFNPHSQRIICEIRFSVSQLHGVEKMCLLASHAWKNIATSSHWPLTRLGKMRAFTSRAPYAPAWFRRRSKSGTTRSGESAEVNVSDHEYEVETDQKYPGHRRIWSRIWSR